MKLKGIFINVIILLVILTIYRIIFINVPLINGDWVYYFQNGVKDIIPFSSWDVRHNGLGQNMLRTFWIELYFTTTVQFARFISWAVYERVFWFLPAIIISIIGAYHLSRKLLIERTYSFLSSLIFSTNTYILLVMGGGQMGVALGYAIVPVVVYLFIKLSESFEERVQNTAYYSLLFASVLAIQVMFDLRFAYMTLAALFLFFIIGFTESRKFVIKKIVFSILIPGIFVILLHAFWLIPLSVLRYDPVASLSSEYTSVESVKFFSFAKFEDVFSLLHPNWPENIFGKVQFLRPEFLLLPILAFASLLFVNREQKTKRVVLFFVILALIGTFLGKGSNEPFGELYLWFFSNIPGFNMFRDSTKWYTLVAISYSVLIPLTLSYLVRLKKLKIINHSFLVLIFIIFWVFLIKDSYLGNLRGIYQSTGIPSEYQKLEDYLTSQNKYFKTLWIPQSHRISASSSTHPVIMAPDFLGTGSISAQLKKIINPLFEKELQDANISYVIVPMDTNGVIFTENRAYSRKLYDQAVRGVRSATYLNEVTGFGDIKVFQVNKPRERFWSEKDGLIKKIETISPTLHRVTVESAVKGDVIVFAENYDAYWYARNNQDDAKSFELGRAISSSPYNKRLNSFTLRDSGDYTLEMFYLPQKYVDTGLIISGITGLLVVGTLIIWRPQKRKEIK